MREISNEKAFLEMAEAVFQERKEKLEEIKRHEEEKTKIREEKIVRIAKICLEISIPGIFVPDLHLLFL